MCGIVGQVRTDGAPVDRELIERMCRAIEHRGPDSRGVHMSEGVGLGIQRLRVIDLNTGDQPIYNEDRSVAVVLNGEIYNYREIRQRLTRAGHRFATSSDTEVIAHLYEERGADCVQSLHGMFALALWDSRQRHLLLARDRVGKKPLFYALRQGALTFASELNAVMLDEEVPRDLDHQALDAFFAFGWVPAPCSAFRAVRKLPPATVMLLSGGKATAHRYWRLDYSRKRQFGDRREMEEELRAHLRRAVRRRMIADVPLGAFLSGGIDSSAVVAAMAESSPRPVRTFSIGFTSDRYNELPKARLIAERFGTDHEELVVEPKAIEIIQRTVRHYGEPFADSSAIPSFYLAEMARRHVTVALNGDGGDESFAGYTHYISNLAAHRAGIAPRPLRRALAAAGRFIPASPRIDSARSRALRLAQTIALEPHARYTAYRGGLNGLRRDALYTAEYCELIGDPLVPHVIATPWQRSEARHPLDVMLDVDAQTYLPDDLLVKMDIATMAYSLEARSPLLDHELMQFAASLPPSLKLRRTQRKLALRAALRGWIPDEILDAPKRGFCVPIADWFRGELRGFARDVLLDPATLRRGYFQEGYVHELLEHHAAGVEDCSAGIWRLLMFEMWHREVVDRAPAPQTAPGAAASRRSAPGESPAFGFAPRQESGEVA
jgi:asparagine synthase (glutamine-hydrolysing)